jgi:antitoxin MazE
MEAVIKQWGNSFAVQIPAAVMVASNLKLEQSVNVRADNGRIIIEPMYKDELDILVAGITPDNIHEEISFDAPVGKEAK